MGEEKEEDMEDYDDCNIGDAGFPFCDSLGEKEDFNTGKEDDDDCNIGDAGFPFCDRWLD
jgi:hypothetical protein